MANLMDGLLEELKRNRELVLQYGAIGPAGAFAKAAIMQNIAHAELAISNDDVVAMLRIYSTLRENK